MRLTVLGGSGAWPVPGQGCSGYLVTHGGTRLLLDPGPGTVGELLRRQAVADVTAVLVSHSHADHLADLPSLCRARALAGPPLPPLPVFALPGAVDAVLAVDPPQLGTDTVQVRTVVDGTDLDVAGVRVRWRALPHHVPNLGVRLQTGTVTLVYTGDTGPGDAVEALAAGADLLLADATYPGAVPPEDRGLLGSAADAGRTAARAGVRRLVLTHLWPGTAPEDAAAAARRHFSGPVQVARPGLSQDAGAPAPGSGSPPTSVPPSAP